MRTDGLTPSGALSTIAAETALVAIDHLARSCVASISALDNALGLLETYHGVLVKCRPDEDTQAEVDRAIKILRDLLPLRDGLAQQSADVRKYQTSLTELLMVALAPSRTVSSPSRVN